MTERSGSTPFISVVVPFYNVERYIAQCIKSILAQSYPRERFEIILVDNASTDSSAEIAAGFDGVTRLRQEVPGSYAARNLGVSHSKGEIVATIDPDCTADPGWLNEIASVMSDPGCGIVLGRVCHLNSSRALQLLEGYETEKMAYITDRREKQLYYGYTNNMAFRRTVFDTVGLFPERSRGGDTILVRRAVDALGCDIVRFNPEMRATHLEVDTVKAYYSKRLIYGESNEKITHTLEFRPLRNSERWQVFRRLVRRQHFPVGKALIMLALLAPGALLYESGRRRGMLGAARNGA